MKIVSENHAEDCKGTRPGLFAFERAPALACLGRDLRALYGAPEADRIPDRLRELAQRLDRSGLGAA